MGPEDILWTDRSAFNSELDDLIGSAINSDASPSTRKRPAFQDASSKRQKTNGNLVKEVSSSDYSQHVHPARKPLLEQGDTDEFEYFTPRGEGEDPFVTGSNLIPLSDDSSLGKIPTGPRNRSARHNSNLYLRQWDPSKDNMDYDKLLDQRRNERLKNVDRYVPDYQSRDKHLSVTPSKGSARARKIFPLDKLPDKVKKKIFSLLLVATDPIIIDFYWLRPFVNGHARIPSVNQSVEHDGTRYSIPMSWDKLLPDIDLMRSDMLQFAEALETRGTKTRYSRSPCRGLTTGLLRVSRSFHKLAAPIFYGQNIFKFPCATSAWMQLDSFLATIGQSNATNIQRLDVHVPLWHRGVKEDFVEGTLIDLLSPASRMAVIKPPPHDRLLSAVRNVVQKLLQSDLKALSLDLENGLEGDYWCGRLANDRKMISIAEAEEFVERKLEGMTVLAQLSNMLVRSHERPVLRLCRTFNEVEASYDTKAFHKRRVKVEAEAEKYGWRVDSKLKKSR